MEAGGSNLDYSILFGDSSPAFAFKNEGEWLRTPTFDAGATNVQFYTAGNGGSGSIISVSGLVSGAWTLMGAITNNTAGADYDIPVHSGATQLLFTFTYKSVNSSLDDVIVTGGGGFYVSGYYYRQVTGTESVSVTGLVEETAYYFRVRAEGVEGCASGNSPTGTVTTRSSTVAPPAAFTATAASVSKSTGLHAERATTTVVGVELPVSSRPPRARRRPSATVSRAAR